MVRFVSRTFDNPCRQNMSAGQARFRLRVAELTLQLPPCSAETSLSRLRQTRQRCQSLSPRALLRSKLSVSVSVSWHPSLHDVMSKTCIKGLCDM
jgi:hypothetical protein